eukprot:Phypoly_transcript_05135.p1 GENE.Phypoly_transcript_05135~~Phypoly_transcript_05135.p1  ORF type:complete len:513 (+),score=92.20 Phypoly_transcript_05135:360-1898(+)
MAKTMIGTPYYMSPELFDNKPYNYKSDVWSLGCCVYEMTALRHAFDAKEMPTLIMKILKENPAPIPSHFSSDLSTIIKLMLTKSPSQRPSISDLLQLPFIKAHMQASVQDHHDKLIEPSLPSVLSPTGIKKPSVVSRDKNRDKADDPIHDDDLQRKLELKLKKIEGELKSESRVKTPVDKERPNIPDKKIVNKHDIEHPNPTPRSNNDDTETKKRNNNLIIVGKKEQPKETLPKKELQKPPIKKEIKKEIVGTPRSNLREKEKEKERKITPMQKPQSQIKSKDPTLLEKKPVLAKSNSPLPKKNVNQPPVQTNQEANEHHISAKMDDIALQTERDFFAARMTSLKAKHVPMPNNVQQKQVIEDASSEEFPVVECAYDNLTEEDDSEKFRIGGKQGSAPIEIDQVERDMEMDEMISIYDSYIKNGVDDISDSDEADNLVNMTGNLSERINHLKLYCKEGLGTSLFEKVYNLMKYGAEGDDERSLETQVEHLIGEDNMLFFNSIQQIIFCEHSL